MIRHPAVADRFYPGDPDALARTVHDLFGVAPAREKRQALAVVSPHAGYVYSGAVAAETLATVNIPDTVIILGPNHHGQGRPIALSKATWQMPGGEVPVATTLADLLLQQQGPIEEDELAHHFEHSLEVQVPLLQALSPALHIVPLVLSHISYPLCQEVAQQLARGITAYTKNVLIVASSDMSHYVSRQVATNKDNLALAKVTDMDPEGLYTTVTEQQISMCGFIPVTIALLTAKLLGGSTAEIIRYTDSGEVSGDTDQVVGYAGVVIS